MNYISTLLFLFALLLPLSAPSGAIDTASEEGGGGRRDESYPSIGLSTSYPALHELGKALDSTFEKQGFPRRSYPLYDLSTSDLKFFSYFARFKRMVEEEWEYPIDSQVNREEGELTLLVDISKEGRVEGVTVTEPSPYQRLDDEAVRAVRMAGPFPPFPSDWDLKGIRIRARFSYVLDRWWEKDDGAGMAVRGRAPSFADIRAAILGKFERHAVISKADFEIN